MQRISHVLAHQDRYAEMQVETTKAQIAREWTLAHGERTATAALTPARLWHRVPHLLWKWEQILPGPA